MALAPRAYAADQQAVGELAQAANGLPLALILLGGYLDAVDYTPAEEPLASNDEPAIVERHRLEFARQRLGTHTHTQTTLQQVIALCMAVLPDAVLRALRILGVFAPYPATFTRQAALAVTGVDDRLLNQLINRRLLDRVNSRLNTAGMSELLTIHAGVAGVARARADAQTAAHHRAFYLAQSVMAREAGQPIDHCYAQIRHAWQNAPDEPALIEFAWALQPYLQRKLLTTDQALLANRCQAIIASAAGSKSTLAAVELPAQLNCILDLMQGASTLAEVLHHIGLAYDSAGRYDKAVSFYNRALSIQEKHDDALATAKTLRQMGESYASLGMIEESQEYFTRALTAFEHLQQAETGKPRGLRAVRTPPPPAAVSSDLGTIYNALGRYDQALSILQRNLEVTETTQRDDSPAQLAETLYQVAYASDRLGQSEKALEYYQRALDLYEVLGNRSDAQRAVILNRMGVIYAGKGQAEKALIYHNLALGLADRDGAAATNNHIADAALLLGKPEQALIYVQRALSVYEASNTQPAWLGAARAYRIMGHAQRRLGQREQTLESFQRAKALYERAGASAKPANEDSLDLADVLVQIGEMLRKLLQLSKALDMLLQALALLEALLKGLPTAAQKGERLHTRVIAQIGAIYTSLGSPEPAMQYLARALPLQEQSGDAAGESETRYHLALLHQSQGRLDKSVSNLQRAIELDQQLVSEELADHQALLAQVQSAMQTDRSNGNKPRGLFAFLRRR
jgi:tetratricopeptide (TPR) repeat protein